MLRQATVKGPDIDVTASGPIALDAAGQSNVKYHVAATDLVCFLRRRRVGRHCRGGHDPPHGPHDARLPESNHVVHRFLSKWCALHG